jgi:hypothetical protein
MKDIALAGFVMTAEEWGELDAGSRQQLVAAAQPRSSDDDGWVVANIRAILSAPKPEEA